MRPWLLQSRCKTVTFDHHSPKESGVSSGGWGATEGAPPVYSEVPKRSATVAAISGSASNPTRALRMSILVAR